LPLRGRDPLHAPEAEQLDAFDDVQVNTDDWPVMMACGEALISTVGGMSAVPPPPDEPPPPPPQPAIASGMAVRITDPVRHTVRTAFRLSEFKT